MLAISVVLTLCSFAIRSDQNIMCTRSPLFQEMHQRRTRNKFSDRHSAIYEKIMSTGSQPEDDEDLDEDDDDDDDDEDEMSPSDFAFDKPHRPPPVPARVTRPTENTQYVLVYYFLSN